MVTAIAACLGFRPVANAFGASSRITNTRGFGKPLAIHNPSTKLCRRRNSTGSAGTARLTASATESDFQYEPNANTAENTNAIIVPVAPFPMSTPTAIPTNTVIRTNPVSKKNVRRLLDAMRSFMKLLTSDPTKT